MKSNLSVIILNWNGEEDTIQCIDSLFISTTKNFNLIIVDNGSRQENIEKLVTYARSRFMVINMFNSADKNCPIPIKTSFDDGAITIIRNNENLGFAKANNIGIKYSLEIKSETVILLNNDTIITNDFINNLVAFSNSNPEYVALTPKIFLAEPSDVIWNCGGKITWYGNRKYYYAGKKSKSVPIKGFQKISFITGCALFFKPCITGMLTEKFFFGEEDFEFSLRLKKLNLKMACVFDSVIYHKVGQSIKKQSSETANSLFLHYASRLIDHKDYYSGIERKLIKIIHIFYGFYLTTFKYSYSIKDSIKLWVNINTYVDHHYDIPKKEFFRIIEPH